MSVVIILSFIARWHSLDPKADKYPGWSPYNYCLNNPTAFVDPNGDTDYVTNMDDAAGNKMTSDISIFTGVPFKMESTGPVVDNDNLIRGELGADYGKRTQYGYEIDKSGRNYIKYNKYDNNGNPIPTRIVF